MGTSEERQDEREWGQTGEKRCPTMWQKAGTRVETERSHR